VDRPSRGRAEGHAVSRRGGEGADQPKRRHVALEVIAAEDSPINTAGCWLCPRPVTTSATSAHRPSIRS
jgi:hypothetical protein